MPASLLIRKRPAADEVEFQGAAAQIKGSAHRDADGVVRLVVSASGNLNSRPGPHKSVTFGFQDQASRSLFTALPPEPFVLGAGQSLVLTLNQLSIGPRPAGSASFSRREDGSVDPAFTVVANFRFIDPASPHHNDHDNIIIEC